MVERLAAFGDDRPAGVDEACRVLSRVFPCIEVALEALGALRRRHFADAEVREVRRRYPYEPTLQIASDLGWPVQSIYGLARRLGLSKAESYRQRLVREAGARLQAAGRATRFPKGHVPWTKGKAGALPASIGGSTRFRAGHRPANWRPVGAVVADRDGYLKIKVANRGKQVERWRYVHVLLFEQHHGAVPEGFAVVFRDGRRRHLVIENLELVSRADLMRRNSIHCLPQALRRAITAKARLTRIINERSDDER